MNAHLPSGRIRFLNLQVVQFRSNLINFCLGIPQYLLWIDMVVRSHHGNPSEEQPANRDHEKSPAQDGFGKVLLQCVPQFGFKFGL